MSETRKLAKVADSEVDCDPQGCGLGCTSADRELAVKRASDLCARLGSSWTSEVWDNLGWRYCAINDAAAIVIHASHYDGRVDYTANMGGHRHSDRGLPQNLSESFDDPRAALRQVIVRAMELATALNAAVLAAVQSDEAKSQPQITGKTANRSRRKAAA